MVAELGKHARNPEAMAITEAKQSAECSKAAEAKRISKDTSHLCSPYLLRKISKSKKFPGSFPVVEIEIS